MKRASIGQMITVNFYWVGLSFMWNALHPIILPAVLLNYVPDAQKNTTLGLLTFTGLIIAMIVQPISGAISDGWRSRWGRRRPLIAAGTLLDFACLTVMGWAGGLAWLVIGYIGLQISSNTAHGPVQGLMPDRIPREQLGTASSIKVFMDMLALILASLVAGRLLDPVSRDPSLILGVVIGLLALAASVTVLGTHETPTDQVSTGQSRESFVSQLRVDFHANKAYWWVIAERGLFLLGIYGIQAFAQYYLQDVLRVPDPPRQTGDLLATLTISLVVLTLAGGRFVDKYGAKPVLYASTALASMGMLLMMPARSMTGLLISGSVLGAGIGLFLTANWALASKLAPLSEAGKYLGLTNLATAGAGALARLEGPALDWLNALWPTRWVGYTSLFVFGAACILLSALLLLQVKESR